MCVSHVEQALQLIAAAVPDLVLLDKGLPGAPQGLDLCATLKVDTEDVLPVVVMLTAEDDPRTIARSAPAATWSSRSRPRRFLAWRMRSTLGACARGAVRRGAGPFAVISVKRGTHPVFPHGHATVRAGRV